MSGQEYSRTYSTTRFQYRYNYETGQLEQLGKRVHVITAHHRQFPVVEMTVLQSVNLSAAKFDQCPGYWIELYDSIMDVRRETERTAR